MKCRKCKKNVHFIYSCKYYTDLCSKCVEKLYAIKEKEGKNELPKM
jgi:hypothetical protein